MKLRGIHRRQAPDITLPGITDPPDAPGLTGATSVGTDIANPTSLVVDPTATGASDPGTTDLPDDPPPVPLNPTNSAPDPAETNNGEATTSGATSSSKNIPIGTVVGICVGVFAVLCVLLLIVLWLGRRSRRRAHGKKRKWASLAESKNVQSNAERRKSGREFWTKMDGGNADSFEKFAMSQRSPDNTGAGSGGGGVTRSTTMKSTKSSKTTRSLYGGGLGFANTFNTPELPPQLEFTDQDMGKGHGVAIPRVKAPFTREHDPVSWDGETIANTSFLSLKSDNRIDGVESGAVSPSMVVSRQTPTAIELERPQWEAAELVSPVGETGEKGQLQPSNRQSKNPFLNPAFNNPFVDKAHGSSLSLVSSQSVYSTPSATDSERENSRTMQNLLAALNFGLDGTSTMNTATAARQSNLSSYSDGLSDNFSKFPLPPSHVDRHH